MIIEPFAQHARCAGLLGGWFERRFRVGTTGAGAEATPAGEGAAPFGRLLSMRAALAASRRCSLLHSQPPVAMIGVAELTPPLLFGGQLRHQSSWPTANLRTVNLRSDETRRCDLIWQASRPRDHINGAYGVSWLFYPPSFDGPTAHPRRCLRQTDRGCG